MPVKRLPSAAYLRECFSYNRRTGILRWKRRPRWHFKTDSYWVRWNARYAGTRAGTLTHGYRGVAINSNGFLEHRIIWKLVTYRTPPESIDHIDGSPSNNRLSNLRPANEAQQKWNATHRRNNNSGHRGVYPTRDRWFARIYVNGESRHLGCFGSKKDAAAAYEAAARKFHGEFYRSSK